MDVPSPAPELSDRLVRAMPRCGRVRVACIDGPAGSGKTTLAADLAAEVSRRHGVVVPVVHLDDLYEGWTQDIGVPLSARIDAWLLTPWRDGLVGRYPRYDWGLGRYTAWVEVLAADVVVIEGCGAAAGAIRRHAALTVWIEADPSVRLARGLDRDGQAMAAEWHRWQLSESAHFAADGTRAAADVILRT